MDDLSGLDWSSSGSTNKNAAKPTIASQSSAFGSSSFSSYPSLRPTPPPLGSGRNTPLSAQGSGASAGIAPRSTQTTSTGATKPTQDSFSGLINFGANKNPANLSLRERQEQLDAEKRRKEEEQRRQHQANYGSNGQFFDILGRGGSGATSRTGSPAIVPPPAPQNGSTGDDDLFAAFNADTKVDKSSHFPPPASNNASGKSTPANAPPLDLSNPSAWGAKPASPAIGGSGRNNAPQPVEDDDDPFGLGQMQSKAPSAPQPAVPAADMLGDEDDDLLGDLGRPVEEVRRKAEAQRQQETQQQQRQQQPKRRQQAEPGKPIEDSDSDSDSEPDPGGGGVTKTGNAQFDHAVAQLVDYGFSPEDARRGLTESGRGFDVQAAVNWLLDDAHRQAKEKAQGKQRGAGGLRASGEGRSSSRSRQTGGPAWMRDADFGGSSPPSRGDSRSPAALSDGDFAKTAAAMGTSFLKTANSLWKTGQKHVQKAMQEFQQEDDSSQPRWMRSAAEDHPGGAAAASTATDEAMMLESGGRPERRQGGGGGGRPARTEPPRFQQDNHQASSRNQSPANAASRNSSVPRWQQQSGLDPRSRLSKQALEEESAQAYVSPSRRRKPPTPAATQTKPESAVAPQSRHTDEPPEGDLLSNSTAPPQRPAQRPQTASTAPGGGARSTPRPTPSPRPAAAPRQVPPVNSFVLKASAQHRAEGAAHFKRGDYAAAHASYSSSLTDIPPSHPLLAVLFCNRALTALKTGEPRQAVADADAALAIIGPSKGEGESVALEDGSGATRDLKDLYGKALTRKAEALEQMEKWAEAGQVWQQCVEGGIGGATAKAGRQRCQTALAPKPKPTSRPASSTPSGSRPRPKPSAASSSSGGPVPTSASGQDFAAVARLRAANQASEREDAEKLALIDQVDARIAGWRDGKKDNLRALLGSLDAVLWEGSGWKKVGLHELVMPNKVKVVYMRAIAKTHPDKLPQDASTEIRMVAGTVFATLNESWDKFKAENKM